MYAPRIIPNKRISPIRISRVNNIIKSQVIPQSKSNRDFLTFVNQYERAVTLTLGKLTSVKDPGIRICLPVVQEMFKVDIRTRVHLLQPQDIFTKDNVSTKVDAIVYYRVVDAEIAVLGVADVDAAVQLLVQGQLRDTLCRREFSDILAHRDAISNDVLNHVKGTATKWGVQVENFQLKNVDIVDPNMIRAMAKEAEATRDRIAAIIRAEGELQAAKLLVEAADIMGQQDISMELRRLQTLEKISKEKSQHTVIVPMDFGTLKTNTMLGLTAGALRKKKDADDNEKPIDVIPPPATAM